MDPDFVGEGKKRYAFLDFMALRRPGGTGDHLKPKAPRAGPLAIWHKATARLCIRI